MLAGLGVKVAAAVSLAGGSYLTGTLPSCLGLGKGCGQSLMLSLVLCCGAGVLFATSIIHILPEARVQLPTWADVLFCIGFMVLYTTDEFVKLFEPTSDKVHCHLEAKGLLDRTVHHQQYGASDLCHEDHQDREDDTNQSDEIVLKMATTNNRSGLLLALTIHSIIEGFVIGVQPASGKVLLLLGAVSSHKLVVAFCLGAELASDGRSFTSLSHTMIIYSLGSGIGIFLGVLADQWRNTVISTIPILQAIAAGSLLYVTVSEVLPRERSRWEHEAHRPFAGLLQLVLFSLGFFIIASLVFVT